MQKQLGNMNALRSQSAAGGMCDAAPHISFAKKKGDAMRSELT